MRHIVDHPKTRDGATKLARFAKIDRGRSDKPSAETTALTRAPRRREASEKLKRFAEIERQGA